VCDWWLGDMRENSAERFERELEFDRFIAQVKAEALEEFKAHIDASTAVLWIGEGGVKERIITHAAEYHSGART
jgi:hypothetical protein